ncbi:aminotransferase class V-fold PLP-dependent enzyme [Helicobacter sp. MIT 11-5569]|uniref:aminotransferase class V-fold PLP-dependent enzyme n=1 Tax=Helicobacter sp. MIT 11-5569 TaxID=1548151 RepID=UPI0009E05787|nr:aminotransferase class V-fold PLP-dependent enzyme [Helicobacter sp. MIT 11-5569]TLD84407.1 aminotransferase class V-fold PLP-dependent enzyme [Helicobacter sp. MIT 11-5569]
MDFFTPLFETLPKDLESKRILLKEACILQKGFHYFDWTASGLAAKCVESRIQSVLPFYANTHSQSNANAELMDNLYEGARERLKGYFGLDSNFALISCGFGSTAAIKKFQELLGIYIPPKTKSLLNLQNLDKSTLPLVIIGPYEHHSNELSFREGLCEVVRVPLNAEGLFDLNALKKILNANKGRKIISSFSLGSNVSGILIPYQEISHLVRQFGGIVCFDCASSAPYFEISPQFYDAIFLSPHKLFGGIGSSGILIIHRALIDKTLPPTFCGGGTVGYVSRTSAQYFGKDEQREEAGTPGILEFLRAYLGFTLRQEIKLEWIKEAKLPYIKIFREFLENEPRITYYGNLEHNTLGIFSFNINGISPFAIAQELSKKYGILVRAGCSCAGPYGHDLLELEDNTIFTQKPGWIRLNLHYTHTQEEITHLLEALKAMLHLSFP